MKGLVECHPVLREKELRVIIHALEDAYDRIVQGGGDYYGVLSIEELHKFIFRLRQEETIMHVIEGVRRTIALNCAQGLNKSSG